MSELRETAIQRVLHRESLLMGGERELVLFTLLVAVGLVISAQNLLSIAIALPLYVIVTTLLRMMAKVDPYLSKVYTRQLRYQIYYPARSTPFVMDR